MIKARFIPITLCILFIGSFSSAHAQEASDKEQLSVWIQSAAENILSLGFNDYDSKMKANRIYFTDYGYKEFSNALKNSRYRDSIVTNKMVLMTKVLCPPKIESTDKKDWMVGEPNNIWQAEFPIELVWTDGKRQRKDYQNIQAIISDQNSKNPDDFGIEQWIGEILKIDQLPECAKTTSSNAPIR